MGLLSSSVFPFFVFSVCFFLFLFLLLCVLWIGVVFFVIGVFCLAFVFGGYLGGVWVGVGLVISLVCVIWVFCLFGVDCWMTV